MSAILHVSLYNGVAFSFFIELHSNNSDINVGNFLHKIIMGNDDNTCSRLFLSKPPATQTTLENNACCDWTDYNTSGKLFLVQ